MKNDSELNLALGFLEKSIKSSAIDEDFNSIAEANRIVLSCLSDVLDSQKQSIDIHQLKTVVDTLATSAEICEKLSAHATLASASDALKSLLDDQ